DAGGGLRAASVAGRSGGTAGTLGRGGVGARGSLAQRQLTSDVVIVGAGVVGAAIARDLTRFELTCTLLEAGRDVGVGTSKANTALLHTGFDAKPGTLEARLVRRGYELLSAYAPQAGIPVAAFGSLLVAWDAEQVAA